MRISASGCDAAVSAGSVRHMPRVWSNSRLDNADGSPSTSSGFRDTPVGNRRQRRSCCDGCRSNDDVDMRAWCRRFVRDGMVRGRMNSGNKGKQVSCRSSRAPRLDWPGHSWPSGSRRKPKCAEALYVGSGYRVSYRVPADSPDNWKAARPLSIG